MGYDIFSDNLSKIELTDKCKVLSTISPNSYAIAEKDSVFKKSLLNSDFIVLDGVYFGLAAILTQRKIIKTNNGPSVYDFFIKKMNRQKGRVFFLGSNQETLGKIKSRLNSEYPDVFANFFSPPFKTNFSESENKEIITTINNFKPDIVFVGMTCLDRSESSSTVSGSFDPLIERLRSLRKSDCSVLIDLKMLLIDSSGLFSR